MAHQKLQIETIDTQSNFVRLSNGHKYLFKPDDLSIMSSWRAGMTVWIGEADYPPHGYELRSADAMNEFIIAIWVAS